MMRDTIKIFRNQYHLVAIFSLLVLVISCSDESQEPVSQFNLITQVEPEDGGTISPSSGSYNDGKEISLLATPSDEYIFKNWSDGSSGTQNPITVLMTSNKNITAVFEKKPYPLTLTITGEGKVTEEIVSNGRISDYPSGTTVRLTAIPSDGWEFDNWGGDYEGTDNPLEITINEKKTISVIFTEKQEMFVSKSPSYTYPNNTVGQIITSKYFSGNYIVSQEFKTQFLMDNHGKWGRDGLYFDYNKDGYLDYFAYVTNYMRDAPGKFILINNILGDNPTYNFYDTDIMFFGSMELNQIDNDENLEIIACSQNAHDDGMGGHSEELPVKIIDIDINGSLTERNLDTEAMGVHDFTSGDVDNDGDVDILIWRYNTFSPNSLPILYFNDGNGNFTRSDPYTQFKGLQNIIENIGQYQIISVEFFDLNNDGNLDIITGQALGQSTGDENSPDYKIPNSRIYWGDGSGEFDFENNFTDLPNTSITDFSPYKIVLGFTFFDYDSDSDYDVIAAVTNDYGGYLIQLYEQISDGVFEDVTVSAFDSWYDIYPRADSEDGKVPHFYNPRIFDKNNDGLFDIVPSDFAARDFISNLHWENTGGGFIRREYDN